MWTRGQLCNLFFYSSVISHSACSGIQISLTLKRTLNVKKTGKLWA